MPGQTKRLLARGALIGLLSCLPAMLPRVASAVECTSVEFRQARSTVCRVDLKRERLRLFLRDAQGTPYRFFAALARAVATQREQLTFAMNAGIYREDYLPVGLLVIDGHQVHRLNLATGFGNFYMKPNGVFVLSASGARIVASTDYASLGEPPQFATQSGPLLVQAGQLNPALNPQGTSRLLRNGVGVTQAQEVIFAISEDPVTFYEFAQLFREQLRATDALYLDGNVSSLYAPQLHRDDEGTALGPIFGVTIPSPP